MNKFLLIIINLIIFPNFLFAQNEDIIEGDLLVKLKKNYFDLPQEAYAIYISFISDSIVIDSVITIDIDANTRKVLSEKILHFDSLKSTLSSKIKLKFTNDIVSLFKMYKVYFIKRFSRNFAYADTIPKYKKVRTGWKWITKQNQNKILEIKFKDKKNTIQFKEALEAIKQFEYVNFNQKAMQF